MFKQLINRLLNREEPVQPKPFDKEQWERDYDAKNYPESEKYFDAAKKLLEKYPAEEWEIKPTLFYDTKTLEHKNCLISFCALFNPFESTVFYSKAPCKMSIKHRKIIFSLFKPLFDRLDAKCRREQEEKQNQFDQKLQSALSD